MERRLSAGADPNARDMDGWIPLHAAAEHGSAEAAAMFLDADADPAARTAMGKTPFDLPRGRGSFQGTDVCWRLHDGRFE